MRLFALGGLMLLAPALAAAPRHPRRAPARPVAHIVRLEVQPTRATLNGPLAREGFLATAVLSDGARQDVTGSARLSTNAPRILSIDGWHVAARHNGSAIVAVRFGSLAARVPVQVVGADRPIYYSFQNDVIPTLAHIGCSAGSCHGANSGKGGFKLSLRGYAPELDFLTLTRQYGGRRICREDPEMSLILRKPTLQVRHGGGHVLEKGSPEYYTLLGWLREGAPPVDEKDPKLTALSLLPGDRIYHRNEHQQILVRAAFSDGHTEDITDRALYGSNDVAVAQVSKTGEITALNPGSTAVAAKYMDKVAVVRVTVPFPQKIDLAAFKAAGNPIDNAVYAKLKELHIEPGPLCTDAEFVRRVYIDALGTLPTADEARAFLDSKDPDKRNKLIDAVLKRPEYADVWSLKLADLFLMRNEHMERKNCLELQQWMTAQFQENRPWDQFVTDLITASGSTEEKPETLWWISRQASRPNAHGWIRSPELTGEIAAQVFLGTRIQCARCHNHPTERYTQDDYYHFAAIFARVNGKGPGDPVPQEIVSNDPGEVRQPRTGEVMTPQPIDRTVWKLSKSDDPRVAFAQWLTRGPGSQQFARNIANRIWDRLFGSGIVEPVDDQRSTNPPKNEALLNALAQDLIRHRYDLKYLIATIMRSHTYQSSSTPTRADAVDTQFFSHYPVRRLGAEELVDAVAQVTGVPEKFATFPLGTRAIELPDIQIASTTLDTFGRPVRVMPTDSERSCSPSMSQALYLFNGEELQRKLKNPDGRLAQLLKSPLSDTQLVEELFLTALARRPSPQELGAILKMIPTAPSRREAMEDVLWALVNSKEFMFNH